VVLGKVSSLSMLKSITKWNFVGVLCENRIFDEDAIVATPEYLSDDEACTLQVAAMTAWMAINGTRPLGSRGGKGEVILIQGTGGVSINGLLIAKASGAEGISIQHP
jgi:NADPH:quinone reductase-like Zn-dependent oxidoreductase